MTMEIQEEIAADMKRIRADLSDIKEELPAMLQDLDVMEQCTENNMYHLSASCVGALHLSPCPQRYGRVCASLANVRDSIVIDAVPFSMRR